MRGADLFVEGALLIEIKAIEKLAPVHFRQVLTYLRILELPHGLLLNFGARRMSDGIHRITDFHQLKSSY